MNLDELQLRRATVDDVEPLMHLWTQAGMPGEELEKRLTEFQVAQAPGGQIIAAMGLKRADQQGCVHHDAYLNPEEMEELRPLLWERVLNVARNSGLVRVWINDDSPFWKEQEFAEAKPETMEKLPPGFGDWKASWKALQLRDELAEVDRLEKEIEMFKLTNQQDNNRIIQQAKVLKTIAIVFATVVAIAIIVILVMSLIKYQPAMFGR